LCTRVCRCDGRVVHREYVAHESNVASWVRCLADDIVSKNKILLYIHIQIYIYLDRVGSGYARRKVRSFSANVLPRRENSFVVGGEEGRSFMLRLALIVNDDCSSTRRHSRSRTRLQKRIENMRARQPQLIVVTLGRRIKSRWRSNDR